MSISNLLRWSGLATIVGGVLLVIYELLDLYNFSGAVDEENFSEVAATAPYTAESLLHLLGTGLLLFGLFGLYARQSEAASLLGLVGFLVAFFRYGFGGGRCLGRCLGRADAGVHRPRSSQCSPPLGIILSLGVFTVGWVLFGLATLRARVYPRVASTLLIVGAVLAFFPLSLSTVLFGAAIAWLGLIIPTGGDASAVQPSRVK